MTRSSRRRPTRGVVLAVGLAVVLPLAGVAAAEVSRPEERPAATSTTTTEAAATPEAVPSTGAPSPVTTGDPAGTAPSSSAAGTAGVTGETSAVTEAPPPTVAAEATWVSAWQGSPVPGSDAPAGGVANCPAGTGLADQTVRNVVPVSTGGSSVRIRISNVFGDGPLRIGAASVAVAGEGAAVEPGTLRPLLFTGQPTLLVAQGGEALSDPVQLDVQPLQQLALSVFLPGPTGAVTHHPDARATSHLAGSDRTQDTEAAAFGTPITCWMFATGVDVQAAPSVVGTVVTLGDSITDGDQSSSDADQRYPDWLARRLAELPGETLAVSNAGISGNELLEQRAPGRSGPAAPARLARDVLGQAGVRAVIVLEGINDIGARGARAEDLIAVHEQLVTQARAAGLPVLGGTLLPFAGSTAGGSYGSAEGEVQRQAFNEWVRTSGTFDGVVDFDAALRDPADPTRLLPAYDSGDHLHPGDAGYRAMAEAVDLPLLLALATGRG